MKEKKIALLRVTYAGKSYATIIDSTRYTGALVINKLKIGYSHYWLIFQNESWRFIGDMPLCGGLKNILIHRIAALHELPIGSEAPVMRGQQCFRTGILLNAVLSALALKQK